ncbi:hypothetical protein PDJAM_G00236460 [Pangasius djambal]|uniref:Uncharacterized protein n=1 Tax=Pangasius djambal TaxID=1691987 RepID=A0ACC5YFR3_9TELE|nr:hypothetical protein [Pangasius djambal]
MEDWSLSQSTQRRSFTSLIASRLGRKRRLQSESELQEASISLINRNQNISALLQETAAGAGGHTLTCERRVGEIRANVLQCELRRQADELCVPVSVLSVRMVMDRMTALQGDRDSAMISSAHRLQSLCECGVTEEEGDVRHHILSTVVCVLVRVGFEDVQDSSVSHSCCSVLDSMLS